MLKPPLFKIVKKGVDQETVSLAKAVKNYSNRLCQ